MSKKRNYRLLGGLAVAGVIAAGGSAFTATGLTSNVAPSQFIGGSFNQTVNGATLNDIAYSFAGGPSGPRTHVTGAVLTFAPDAAGRSVAMVLSGSGDSDVFVCSVVTDTDPDEETEEYTSTCTANDDGYQGATGVAVTVS